MVTYNVSTYNITIDAKVRDYTTNVTINSSANTYIAAGGKFRFDGAAGDTYFTYNTSASKLELWIDGTKRQQWG